MDRRQRHGDREGRALARLRAQLDAMTEHARDAVDDGKSEAKAALATARRGAQAGEFLEHQLMLLRRDAGPVVEDGDGQLRAHAPAADQDARTLARPVAVADRVGQEILQHAAQQGRIALGDGAGRDVAQFDTLFLGDRRERGDQRLQ
jgi:hypothetical protein